MKKELLVPASNFASLISAINAGADAVYIGGKKFSARKYADNFSDEEIIKAIDLCHLYGVTIFVTVNTLINDNEFMEAVKFIEFLYENNVDAVIMQDVGLINYIHNVFPNLEIHASTQMHVHNADTLKFLENLGVKRVVFARELEIDYINSIKTNLEKEVFIHGALCISYSGQCLFSSLIMNRSGNKGACAGMCRLPYELECNKKILDIEDKYLLSPKELCSIPTFKKLMESDIDSFKVEGRMKSADYVYIVTKIYHGLMEQYYNNEELQVNEEDFKLLKAIYNREFTIGHLFNDQNLMNLKSSNHLGLKVGDVLEISKKKIKIKLSENIKQFDKIRFKNANKGATLNFIYDKNDKLISEASKGNIIYLDNFLNINNIDEIYLTKPYIKRETDVTKKVEINLNVSGRLNEKLHLEVTDGKNVITINKDIIEKANNYPLTKKDFIRSISKLNNTPYVIRNINLDIDNNIFINVKNINELRREFVDLLTKERIKKKKIVKKNYQLKSCHQEKIEGISILVRTKEQLNAAKEYNLKRIYVTDKNLLEANIHYRIPRDLLTYIEYNKPLLTDYGSMYKYRFNHTDYYLNVTNKYTLDYLTKFSNLITLSVELTLKDIENMKINDENVEVMIYGNIELMIMKYCPVSYLLNKNKNCQICKSNNKYYLVDRNNKSYPIVFNNETHSTTLMNYKKTDLISEIKRLKQNGVNNFRIELLDEDYEETKKIIERVLENE